MIKIIKATTPKHLEIVKELFIEYQKFLGFSLCFQDFEEELAKLPYKYAEPEGSILLALVDEKYAGVVAVKKLEEGVCEMKRLYLKSEFQGLGLGRKLAENIMEIAKEKDYKTMKLDTLKRLESAVSLYQKLGFQETQPYNYNPQSDIIYFEKELWFLLRNKNQDARNKI